MGIIMTKKDSNSIVKTENCNYLFTDRATTFIKFASNVSHLEELMCYDCRFSLYCNCIRR